MGSHNLAMGCVASIVASLFLEVGKYDDLTVTGFLTSNLEILPGQGDYVDKAPTILKIKESFWLSKDDFAIEGLNGRHFLKMTGEEVSKKGKRDMMGLEKKDFAWYSLDTTTNTAYIGMTLNKKSLVLSTIKKSGKLSRKAGLDVFMHNPAIDWENLTEPENGSSIYIRGDFSGKNYAFLTRHSSGYSKIAETLPEWEGSSEKGHYFVNVGSRIDIGFIGICAIIIDELFS